MSVWQRKWGAAQSITCDPPVDTRYRLVIFDFDGTLADSLPWVLSVMDPVAEKFNLPRLSLDQVEELRRTDAAKIIQQLGVPLWKLPAILNHMRRLMARDIDQIPLFEGMRALLHHLASQGVTLAVVSSNTRENIQHVLGPETGRLISYYECGTSIFGKQDKFRRVLRRSGVAAHQVLCIGDEVRDLEAAKGENIDFGAVAWGYTKLDLLLTYGPQAVFTTVEDILATVMSHMTQGGSEPALAVA